MTPKDRNSKLVNIILIIYTLLSTLSYLYLFYQVESLSKPQETLVVDSNVSDQLSILESRYEKAQIHLHQKVVNLTLQNDSLQTNALQLQKQHLLLQQELVAQHLALKTFVDTSKRVVIDSGYINDSLLIESLTLNDSLVFSDSLCVATNKLLIRAIFTQDSIIDLKDSLVNNCSSNFRLHQSNCRQIQTDNLSLKNNLHREHLKSKVFSVGCMLLSGTLITSFLIQ